MESEEQSLNIQHFISYPGLHHLAENIFRFVDNPTLAKCREVSKEWNSFLEKIWLLRHLKWFLTEKKFAISTSLGGVKTMTEINKEWSVILYYLEEPSQLKIWLKSTIFCNLSSMKITLYLVQFIVHYFICNCAVKHVDHESIKSHSCSTNDENNIVKLYIEKHSNATVVSNNANQWFLCNHTGYNHGSMQNAR